jgi:hypothetical protein
MMEWLENPKDETESRHHSPGEKQRPKSHPQASHHDGGR